MSLVGTDSLLQSLSNTRQSQMLVQEKLAQWTWFERFLGLNPDVAARWEQHKTFEILKDEHLLQR
jgi:hypothetical protein